MPGPEKEEPPTRNRVRDFWQLDVPLVLVLVLCIAITAIEARRAGDGVWRAWIYMFEWPLIGAFSIWIWHRFRTEGNPVRATTQRWRDRAAAFEAEAAARDAAEADVGSSEPQDAPAEIEQDADPGIAAWQDYRRDLHRREPPGGPH